MTILSIYYATYLNFYFHVLIIHKYRPQYNSFMYIVYFYVYSVSIYPPCPLFSPLTFTFIPFLLPSGSRVCVCVCM